MNIQMGSGPAPMGEKQYDTFCALQSVRIIL